MKWKHNIHFDISKIFLPIILFSSDSYRIAIFSFGYGITRNSENLTKGPGSIQGQPFNIANCNNCTITLLDHCDQVQIDDATNCKIFIGASSESIFLRDCKNCTLTVASKQFRSRDCTNCTVYLYCVTVPIIETSIGMR